MEKKRETTRKRHASDINVIYREKENKEHREGRG